jgi:hypothetical protein
MKVRAGAAFALLAAVVLGIAESGRPKVLLPFELASASADSSRMPGMIAAIVGLAAVYVLLARGMDRRAGAYAVIVLATTPLWFVHARTLTGAIVPMAAGAIALTGLFVAAIDERAGRAVRVAGVVAALVAAAVLVRSRGIAILAAVSFGIAAAAWLRERRVIAGAIASIGVGFALVAFVRGTVRNGSFDAPITQAIYVLAPWSPLAPFALVRRPRSPAQLAACVSAIAALVVHAGLGAAEGADSPLLAAPFVALAIGAMLRDLDDAEQTSTLLAAAVFAVGALIARDVGLAPERMLLGLGVKVEAAAVPAVGSAANVVRVATWVVVVTATAALLLSRGLLGLRTMRFHRGALLVAGGVVAGAFVRLHAWPTVLAGLSPGAAVETYVERRRPGEPLAALGVDPRSMSRAARTEVAALPDPVATSRWLDEAASTGQRRFVAVATRELARLNELHRERHHANVPVLAGARDAVVLVASALAPGERSDSPLDALVRADVPSGIRPTNATLGAGAVDVVGWDVAEASGRRQRVRVYLRAHGDAPLRGHCTFVHVDHVPTRFSAEHLDLAYPVALWREGDVIVDEFSFDLPPHFVRGSYEIAWGAGVLPCSDDRRMPVTSGPRDAHHRIPLGVLEVR